MSELVHCADRRPTQEQLLSYCELMVEAGNGPRATDQRRPAGVHREHRRGGAAARPSRAAALRSRGDPPLGGEHPLPRVASTADCEICGRTIRASAIHGAVLRRRTTTRTCSAIRSRSASTAVPIRTSPSAWARLLHGRISPDSSSETIFSATCSRAPRVRSEPGGPVEAPQLGRECRPEAPFRCATDSTDAGSSSEPAGRGSRSQLGVRQNAFFGAALPADALTA